MDPLFSRCLTQLSHCTSVHLSYCEGLELGGGNVVIPELLLFEILPQFVVTQCPDETIHRLRSCR